MADFKSQTFLNMKCFHISLSCTNQARRGFNPKTTESLSVIQPCVCVFILSSDQPLDPISKTNM